MRLIISVLLLAGIVAAFVSLANGRGVLYTSLAMGSIVVPCLIGTLLRWGLGDQNVDS